MLAIVGAAAAEAAVAKAHVAQRFEVTATVQPDGSLEVVEVIAFRFTGGDYTTVERELRPTDADRVEVLEAAMDGRVLPRGDGEGQVEVDAASRRTKVAWHFAPATNRVHVFSLRYRYAGVVRHGDGEDWFRWPPFPSRFDYPIETGAVRLSWPAGARARRTPGVEGPATSASPIENGIEVTVANYRQRDDDVMLSVHFAPGGFLGAEPEWEREAMRADRLAPAFFAAAAMIAAATALALWLFFLRYRRDGPDGGPRARSVTTPPGDLPPALAGAIRTGRVSVAWPQLLGVVFDLARRGALRIEEEKGGGFLGKRKFALHHDASAGVLAPHEQAVMDALFKAGAAGERFDRALKRLGTRSRNVSRAVQSELAAAGLIDTERKEGAKALSVSGVAVILLGLVLALVLAATGLRLGAASLAVPVAFAFAGLTMVMTGAGFSTLTRAGLAASRQWAEYRRHLKAEIKQGRVPLDGEAIGRMLPCAAALGLLAPFGKALQKIQVRDLPPWLRTLDAAGGSAAMAAVIAASSHAAPHGPAGGGSGGGVGAGGSSGAH